MSEGELGKKIKQKILDGDGKVSFAFGIAPILDEALKEFLNGQPEVSPQTLRFLQIEFGFNPDTYDWKRQGCGVKLLQPKEVVNPLGWNKSNHGTEAKTQ
jgi:hypothetical protein